MSLQSWPSALQRATLASYSLIEEVHTLVDADLGHLTTGYESQVPSAFVGQGRLSPLRKRVAVCGLILFGTLVSTLGKLAYQLPATGRDGTVRPFEKPWFMVLLMFIGMGMNLPLSLFLDLVRMSRQRVKALVAGRRARRAVQPAQQQQSEQQQLLQMPLLLYDEYDDQVALPYDAEPPVLGEASASITEQYWQHHFRRLFHKQVLLLLLPTLCDLLGAALLNIGLLSVTASATQMFRQSLLPIAALFGVGCWNKRLNAYHTTGLLGCVVGLGLVAASCLASGYSGSATAVAPDTAAASATADATASVLASSSSSRASMAAGIAMILLSQLLAAGHLLIDQSSWNAKLQLSPLKIVGCEGLLGLLITLFVVLPLADISSLSPEGRGLSEDTWDTLVMISSRPLLQVLLLAYTGSLQAYNICGMITAGELSAVDTTLLQAVRTLFVWVNNLVVHAVAAALQPNRTDQRELDTPAQPGSTAAAATSGTAGKAAGSAPTAVQAPASVGAAADAAADASSPQQHATSQLKPHAAAGAELWAAAATLTELHGQQHAQWQRRQRQRQQQQHVEVQKQSERQRYEEHQHTWVQQQPRALHQLQPESTEQQQVPLQQQQLWPQGQQALLQQQQLLTSKQQQQQQQQGSQHGQQQQQKPQQPPQQPAQQQARQQQQPEWQQQRTPQQQQPPLRQQQPLLQQQRQRESQQQQQQDAQQQQHPRLQHSSGSNSRRKHNRQRQQLNDSKAGKPRRRSRAAVPQRNKQQQAPNARAFLDTPVTRVVPAGVMPWVASSASAAAAAAAVAAAAADLVLSPTALAVHSGAVLPAAVAAASSTGAAVAAAAGSTGGTMLPGEPWLVWSFMQAAGFLVLLVAALTYSRGDSERWRRQLEAEAALIFADMPPGMGSTRASATESFGRGLHRPFTANMDIDSASLLRSSQGWYGGGREPLYGITPTSYASPLPRRGSGMSTPLSRSSGVLEGVSPVDAESEALLQQVPTHAAGAEQTG